MQGKNQQNGNGTTASTEASSAARSSEFAPPAACPAGFTTPENSGVCIKLPAEVKPSDIGHYGGMKAALGWAADGGVRVRVMVGDYSGSLWDTKNKDILAGGGFGGKLLEQGKLGDDGIWATFTADASTMERKLLVSRIHNKKLEVECTAEKQVMSNVGPKIEDVLEACKSITMAP